MWHYFRIQKTPMYVLAAGSLGGLALLLIHMFNASPGQEPPLVAVVPGGGLTLDGLPTKWVQRRLQEADAHRFLEPYTIGLCSAMRLQESILSNKRLAGKCKWCCSPEVQLTSLCHVILTRDFKFMRLRAVRGLDFLEVPDEGVEPDALESRRAREAKSLASFRQRSASISSMQQMHAFLFTEHMAYSSKRLLKA
eukprot:g22901.t1